MKIGVIGLGYVGTVSAACFAAGGHHIVGVDVDEEKVRRIQRGIAPIVEPGLADMLRDAVESGMIEATTDARQALLSADVSLITVGTPSTAEGAANLEAIERVAADISEVLKEGNAYHLVVVRSTVPPGTTERLTLNLEKNSGKRAGRDFGVCMNPEFLREGTAVQDFYDPPYTIIGEMDARSGDLLESIYKSIPGIEGTIYRVRLGEAEMLKYANNCFHAVKVSFANEVGRLCKELGVDGGEVMRLVAADRKLNLSPYYLRPGFAFGGSCLPKDTRATVRLGAEQGVDLPLVSAALSSNDAHLAYAAERIKRFGKRRVGIVGVAFKEGTDDLRCSAALRLVELLGQEGYEVRAYDERIGRGERLLGENRRILASWESCQEEFLAASLKDLLAWADVVVLTDSGLGQLEASQESLSGKQPALLLESHQGSEASSAYERLV